MKTGRHYTWGKVCKDCGTQITNGSRERCKSCSDSSQERSEKISQANKGKHFSHGTQFKKGHETPQEIREKISNTLKGRFVGDKSSNWKGGIKVRYDGRVLIRDPDSPMAKSDGYVYRSRLVKAKEVGRTLLSEEPVHHINGDKSDDRPENLQLFDSNSAHVKYENSIEPLRLRRVSNV